MTQESIDTINAVAQACYDNAAIKGFHEHDDKNLDVANMAVWTANLHGEVSELWEAARKNQLDVLCDKQVNLTCAEEEFADIFIRCCDSAVAYGINLGRAVSRKMQYNATREHKHGKLA
jgi:NTP pyrophosphatase (non-canonical NTP hydrolase)